MFLQFKSHRHFYAVLPTQLKYKVVIYETFVDKQMIWEFTK